MEAATRRARGEDSSFYALQLGRLLCSLSSEQLGAGPQRHLWAAVGELYPLLSDRLRLLLRSAVGATFVSQRQAIGGRS